MGYGSDHRVIGTVLEVHDLVVNDSDVQVPGVSTDGQIEARQLKDGEQEAENNPSERISANINHIIQILITLPPTHPGCRIICRIFLVNRAFIRFLVVI